jgi:AcrR family transcriptional regulator
LTAAAHLFAAHRFHEARMEDIAAAAEVGKGTLYRYFQDKEELYLALLDRAAEGLNGRLDEAIEGANGPRAKLEAFVEAVLIYFEEQPHLLDLIQHAEVMQRPGSAFPWQNTRQETIRRVRAVFAEARAVGAFIVADPEMDVLLLLGGLRAVMRFGPRPRPAGLARQIVDHFLNGAAQPAGKAGWKGRRGAAQMA